MPKVQRNYKREKAIHERPHVLFICGKNRRRSPTAERIYRQDPRVEVRSAGLSQKSPHQVSREDAEWADLILVMERRYKTWLLGMFRGLALPRIEDLDIPDDYQYTHDQLVEVLRERIEPYLQSLGQAGFPEKTGTGDILQGLSAPGLITAIEDNMLAPIQGYAKWPRAEVHDGPEIKRSITDIPFAPFNSILWARLDPQSMDEVVESIIAEGKRRNVPLLWQMGPSTRPTDLGACLERHGFVSAGQAPGMAMELSQLREELAQPADLVVKPVENERILKQWCRTCAEGFELPELVAELYYELMGYMDSSSVLPYLGWMDDRPVATSLLVLGAGVAGIYNVGTIPEARRQGIGAAMTVAALRAARERGYKVAILHSSEMGLKVYRSLGFQEYCKITQYIWSPEGEQV